MWLGPEVVGVVWEPGSGERRCRGIQGPSPAEVKKGGELG